jgi:predicted transcriptional regulator
MLDLDLSPMTPEELRDKRKLLGLSQTDLAEICGRRQWSVSQYEQGERPVPR